MISVVTRQSHYFSLTGTGGKDYVKPSHVCVGNGIPGACNVSIIIIEDTELYLTEFRFSL